MGRVRFKLAGEFEQAELEGFAKYIDDRPLFAVPLQGAASDPDEMGLPKGNPRTDLGAGGVGAPYMARPLFERLSTVSGTVRF